VDTVTAELEKLIIDEKMIKEQLEVLEQFPPFHPKKQSYEGELEQELESLNKQKGIFNEQKDKFEQLYTWSQGIVKSVRWLEKNLEEYCNQALGLTLDMDPDKPSVEEYTAYKKGLDEITFNLQESQDFFDASLDGRLQRFHQIEKCMIDAQLQVIRKYPESNLRRQAIEKELLHDLAYVTDNMQLDPKVNKHREKMRQIHRDFFAVLKWQREKLASLGYGDANPKEEIQEYKAKVDPIPALPDECPVTGKQAGTVTNAVPTSDTDFTIHRLYEKEGQ